MSNCILIYREECFRNFPCHLFNAKSIIIDKHVTTEERPSIYIQVEPEIIFPSEKYLLDNSDKYDIIYTYNENVLKNCKNAKKYYHGVTFIPKDMVSFFTPEKKKFAISCLCGTKLYNNAKGHFLRMFLYNNQNLFKNLPITFFRSKRQHPHLPEITNNPFIDDSKYKLFENYQFSIIIENSKQTNYFTEKLIDCLITKTIPIYWGCPNIEEIKIFNTNGWIIIDSEDFNDNFIHNLINKISILDDNYYNKYLNVIEENAEKAELYRDFNIDNNIVKVI